MPPPGGPRPESPAVRSRGRGQRLWPWARHFSEGSQGGPAQGARWTGPLRCCAQLSLSWAVWKLPTMDSQHLDMLLLDPAVALGTAVFSLCVSLSLSCVHVRVFLSISVICLSVSVHICHLSLSIAYHLSVFHLSSIPYLYLSPAICLSLSAI